MKNFKAYVWIPVGCLLLFVFLRIGAAAYTRIVTPYPSEWLTIDDSMTRNEVRDHVGTPWADGMGLKPVDRWQVTQLGVEMHLDVDFRGDGSGDDKVYRITRWKHVIPLYAKTEKYMNPPWGTEYKQAEQEAAAGDGEKPSN